MSAQQQAQQEDLENMTRECQQLMEAKQTLLAEKQELEESLNVSNEMIQQLQAVGTTGY